MTQTAEVQRVRRRRLRKDDGATLVEFAIVAPILFLLIFGIIEFGWAFGQHLDVRHGAREGSRLVAVNYGYEDGLNGGPQSTALVAEVCKRMDLAGGPTIQITYLAPPAGTPTNTAQPVGEAARVTVTHDLQTLTGFLDFALGSVTLSSSVDTRIERGDENEPSLATWAAGSYTCP